MYVKDNLVKVWRNPWEQIFDWYAIKAPTASDREAACRHYFKDHSPSTLEEIITLSVALVPAALDARQSLLPYTREDRPV
jgi:hypothetical protein